MEKERKAFCNHIGDGVNLIFPNGNTISTIWHSGAYCENRNFDKPYNSVTENGSNTCEIMIDTTNEALHKRIFATLDTDFDNCVIGWLTIDKWLWVVNCLAENRYIVPKFKAVRA